MDPVPSYKPQQPARSFRNALFMSHKYTFLLLASPYHHPLVHRHQSKASTPNSFCDAASWDRQDRQFSTARGDTSATQPHGSVFVTVTCSDSPAGPSVEMRDGFWKGCSGAPGPEHLLAVSLLLQPGCISCHTCHVAMTRARVSLAATLQHQTCSGS